MTSRDFKIYKEDEREIALEREGWCCFVCGKHLSSGFSGRGHIISDSKANNKRYGKLVMNHHRLFRMSCNGNCNTAVMLLGKDPSFVWDEITSARKDLKGKGLE